MSDIMDADDLSFLICDDREGTRFLKVGGYAVFLEGPRVGKGFKPQERGYWYGSLVSDLTLEVEASSYAAEGPSENLLLYRSGTGLHLRINVQTREGSQWEMAVIADDLRPCSDSLRGWYRDWRLVWRDGDRCEVLFEQAAKS